MPQTTPALAAPKAGAAAAVQRAPAVAATAESTASSATATATASSVALGPPAGSQGPGSTQRQPAADSRCSRQPTEVSGADEFLDDALSGLFAPPSYRAPPHSQTADLREPAKSNSDVPDDDSLSSLMASPPSQKLHGLAAQMEQPFSAEQMARDPLPIHIPVTTHLDAAKESGDLDNGDLDRGNLDRGSLDTGNRDGGNLDGGNLDGGNLGSNTGDYTAEDGEPFLMPTGTADGYFDAALDPPFNTKIHDPSGAGPGRYTAVDLPPREWANLPAGQMFRKKPHSGRHAPTASIDPEIRAILDGHREVPDEFGTSYVPHAIDGEHTFPPHSLHRYHYTASTFPRSNWGSHDFNQPFGSTVQHPSAHSFARDPTLPSYALRSVSSPRGPYRIGGIMQLAAWDSSHRSHSAR